MTSQLSSAIVAEGTLITKLLLGQGLIVFEVAPRGISRLLKLVQYVNMHVFNCMHLLHSRDGIENV